MSYLNFSKFIIGDYDVMQLNFVVGLLYDLRYDLLVYKYLTIPVGYFSFKSLNTLSSNNKFSIFSASSNELSI